MSKRSSTHSKVLEAPHTKKKRKKTTCTNFPPRLGHLSSGLHRPRLQGGKNFRVAPLLGLFLVHLKTVRASDGQAEGQECVVCDVQVPLQDPFSEAGGVGLKMPLNFTGHVEVLFCLLQPGAAFGSLCTFLQAATSVLSLLCQEAAGPVSGQAFLQALPLSRHAVNQGCQMDGPRAG